MIKKLPVEVYQKIKAGEIIEDPSAIVRELLDNSIDAQAKSIVVEITDGGLGTISVKDNGIGMSPEDLSICFLEHTTSKIRSFEDIFSLKTNGFRGEALSSICRVAQVSILSGLQEIQTAEKILIDNGNIIEKIQTAHYQGTIIDIKNIFYNLPVRKKFLTSKTRETSKIKKEIIQKALAYPDISFRFISNNKTILNCTGGQTPEARMLELLDIHAPIHPLFFKTPEVNIKGTITGIDQVFDSSSMLYIFINHRPIQSKAIFGVINRALSQLIPKHKYLGGCIYIFTDSKHIDPNIHPAKKEVKIMVEDIILRGLYSSLRSIFCTGTYTTFIDLQQSPQSKINQDIPLLEEKAPYEDSSKKISSIYFEPTSTQITESTNILSQKILVEKKDVHEALLDYRYIGTYSHTYWLVEKDKKMILIDFHAAHERKRYEVLKKTILNRQIQIQPLLMPQITQLSEKDWILMEKTLETWISLGFDIELLGDFNILIRTAPEFIGNNPVHDIVVFIHEYQSQVFDLSDLQDRILKFAACRKSYMANEHVPIPEIHFLLKEIFSHSFPLTCPHGRPFVFILDQKTIESHFLR